MSSLTFVVDGLREKVTVEAGANKPIASFLELLCARRGLDSRRYDVAVRGAGGKATKVDLSLPLRLAGLQATSLLELVLRAPSADGGGAGAGAGAGVGAGAAEAAGPQIRVVLETGLGERVQAAFEPAVPLVELLLHFVRSGQLAGDEAAMRAAGFAGVSLTYLRSSITGGALHSTTLASMGLVSGAAKMRCTIPEAMLGAAALSARVLGTEGATSAAVAESNVTLEVPVTVAPSLSTAPLATAESLALSTPSSPSSSSSSSSSSSALTSLAGEAVEDAQVQMQPSRAARIRATGLAVRSAVKALRASALDADAKEVFETLIRMLDTLVAQPGETRVRAVRPANEKFAARVGRHPGALDILRAVGFTDSATVGAGTGAGAGTERQLVLLPTAEDDEITLGVREVLALEAHSLGARLPAAPEADPGLRARMAQAAARAQAVFNPFKATLLKMDVDPAHGRAEPVLRVLGRDGDSRAGSGGTSGAANEAAASTPAIDPAPASPAHMTTVELRVASIRARAAEIVERAGHRGALDRNTRIAIFDPARSASSSSSSSSSFSSSLWAPAFGGIVEGGWGAGAGAGPGARAASPDASAGAGAGSAAGAGAGIRTGEDEAMGVDLGLDVDEESARLRERDAGAEAARAREPREREAPDPEASRVQAEYLRKRFRDAEREKEGGFRTAAMREAEQLATANYIYTQALVRVQCPDRTVLTGSFGAREPVGAVHAWVRSLLREASEDEGDMDVDRGPSAASTASSPGSAWPAPRLRFPFYLYQTPPPIELAEDATAPGTGLRRPRTVAEAKLAPAALLHLGWGSGVGPLKKLAQPPARAQDYLNDEALALAAAQAHDAVSAAYPVAVEVAPSRAADTGLGAAAASLLAGARTLFGGGAGAGASGASGTSGGGKPAWLKLSK